MKFSIKDSFSKCDQILRKTSFFVQSHISFTEVSKSYFEHVFHPTNTFVARGVFGTLLGLDDLYIKVKHLFIHLGIICNFAYNIKRMKAN